MKALISDLYILFIFSYDDGIHDSVNSNYQVMFGGFSLIFIYIAFTLGKWNTLEQRVNIIVDIKDVSQFSTKVHF